VPFNDVAWTQRPVCSLSEYMNSYTAFDLSLTLDLIVEGYQHTMSWFLSNMEICIWTAYAFFIFVTSCSAEIIHEGGTFEVTCPMERPAENYKLLWKYEMGIRVM
jgi:hypothetical protein